MANFDASGLNDPLPGLRLPGMHYVPIKYVNGSTVIGTSDDLRLCKLPKGAIVLPEFCAIWTDDVDPDSGANLTVALKISDSTTTKTVIAAQALQAVSTRIVASAATIGAFAFFKTTNSNFVAFIEPAVGDIDASAEIYAAIVYTLDESGRYETTS